MAHAPEVRAQVVADLMAGATYEECRAKYKVGLATISAWANAASVPKTETRKLAKTENAEIVPESKPGPYADRFIDALQLLVASMVEKASKWPEEFLDPEYVRQHPQTAVELLRVQLELAERIAKLTGVSKG